MKTLKSSSLILSTATLLPLLLASAMVSASGQQAPPVIVGGTRITSSVDDWSHHHLVFANPGTLDQAMQNRTYDKWLKVVNDPRYVVQQLKRGLPVEGPAAADVAYRYAHLQDGKHGSSGPKNPKGSKNLTETLTKDWSMSLGSTSTLLINQYPAKFNFDTGVAGSCNDFVVFPTGIAGGAAQATIIAFTSIYGATTCPSGPANGGPSVAWAYNTGTGSTANLSPVLYNDTTGSQVALIQTTGTAASLVLLKWSNSGGTTTSPASITAATTATYRGCTAPCFVAIPIKVGATAENDTNSAPFYIYSGANADTLFVGDDSGSLHEYTGVFAGTPAETVGSGWPIALGTTKLTGPVYDPVSTLVFAGDAGGFLYSVTSTGTATMTSSGRLAFNTGGIADAPVVDVMTSVSSDVYVFVGCDGSPCNPQANGNVVQFSTSAPISSGAVKVNLPRNNAGPIYDGQFDNTHYAGPGNTGFLYVCGLNGGVPTLYQVSMATFTTATAIDTIGTAATCSPVTEFLSPKDPTTLNVVGGINATATSVPVTSAANIGVGEFVQIDSEIMTVATVNLGTNTLTVTRHALGTTAATHANGATVTDSPDWMFLSVTAGGTNQGCSGPCLYNYIIGTSTASLVAGTAINSITGIAATGGTTGVIIDNSSTAPGEQQIYYSTLGSQACTGNGTTGSGTGRCAVQTLQSAP